MRSTFDCVETLERSLRPSLVAVIGQGSAWGDFVPGWSDIDILLVVRSVEPDLLMNISRFQAAATTTSGFRIGVSIASRDEVTKPIDPVRSLHPKILQALHELASDSGRLHFCIDGQAFFVPSVEQVRAFSEMSRWQILHDLRTSYARRASVWLGAYDDFEAIRTVTRHYVANSFIAAKMAVQEQKDHTCRTKQEIVDLVTSLSPRVSGLLRDHLHRIEGWSNLSASELAEARVASLSAVELLCAK